MDNKFAITTNFGCSYYDNFNPLHFERDIAFMQKNGLKHVVLCFSEQAHRWYAGSFTKFCHIAKQHNIETWIDPWGWGGIFGGEAFSNLAAWEPEPQLACALDGAYRNVPFLCPNNPTTATKLNIWITAAAATGAQVVFWDEPHFFTPAFHGLANEYFMGCYCPHCRQKFEQTYGRQLTPADEQANEFWQQSQQEFILNACQQARNQGLNNAVCLLPEYDDDQKFYQHLLSYAINKNVDIIGTDPYPALFKRTAAKAAQLGQLLQQVKTQTGKKVNYWVQGFRLKQQNYPLWQDELANTVTAGYDYVSIWSFMACHSMSSLNNFNDQQVWNEYLLQINKAIGRSGARE